MDNQEQELNKFFRFKCFKGLKELGLDKDQKYIDRLNYEISVIEKMKFESYFLIVYDILDWARKNNIPTGPGRGSAAGALVAYCLEITQLDPIKYNLLFERFLNPERIAMPDIDFDIADHGRDDVINYARSKYGMDRVSGLATFGSLKCKGAIKAAARTLGAPYELGEKLGDLTLPPVHGVPPTLKKCYEEVKELAEFHKNKDSIEGLILNWADKLEDYISHSATHASAIVIGNSSLTDTIPLMKDKDGQILSQWDMHEIEQIGLVKFDFLGLTTLSVIAKCLDFVDARHGKRIDIRKIPQDDNEVFKKLQSGDSLGLFQIESSGMRDLMLKVKPQTLDDLGALNAIFRPGPLGSSGLKKWLAVRAGEEKPEYLVPELEPILKNTQGFLIYQEQAMLMAVKLAGYTLSESDSLRKAIGKKLPLEMAKHKDKFINGMVSNKYLKQSAEKLWNDIEAFASYGFNLAHAICYGLLTYQTAWLKKHYMHEYMCALLICQDKPDKLIKYIAHCKQLGIKVLPPDINKSDINFSIDPDNNIRFGLSAIKNIGDSALELLKLAKNNPYKNLLDFISRVDLSKVNKRKLESLVYAGAFDFTGHTRSSMLSVIDDSLKYKNDLKSYESKLETFNKKSEAYNVRNEEIKLIELSGKKSKLKSFKTPVRPEMPVTPILKNIPEISMKELLSKEKELLGYYVSGHPIDKYKSIMNSDYSVTEIGSIESENFGRSNKIKVIAMPTSVEERITKSSGKKMASMILEDYTGSVKATAFPKTWEGYSHYFESGEPLLLQCKTNINVINEDTTTVELIIMEVSGLSHLNIGGPDVLNLDFELDPEKILALEALIKEFAGNETALRIRFKTSNNGYEFSQHQPIKIKNRDAFLRALTSI